MIYLKSVKKFDGNLFIDFGEGNSVQNLGDYYYYISNKTKVEYNFLPYNLKALEFQGLFLL